jgi:hypothetical protein
VARFLSYILAKHTAAELAGRTLYIEGDRQSLNDTVGTFKRLSKKEWTVPNESVEDLEARIRGASRPEDSYLDFIKLAIAKDAAHHGSKLDNEMYPSWYPSTVEEQVKVMYTFE